jgi:hypothetical protein
MDHLFLIGAFVQPDAIVRRVGSFKDSYPAGRPDVTVVVSAFQGGTTDVAGAGEEDAGGSDSRLVVGG